MSTNVPASILSLKGQRVNHIEHDQEYRQIVIHCSRDRRLKAVDPYTSRTGTVNQYLRRQARDVPLFGLPCVVNIELAQVWVSKNEQRIESSDFVGKCSRYTKRFCQLVSGLCSHMSIQAVSRHLDMRWETIKSRDRYYPETTLPTLDPALLNGLKSIGVDEVARAKSQDYITVIYDMVAGHLIGVETGRTSDVFLGFLNELKPETASEIEAVAMDMGPAYQKPARECLPNADIVFDRFHVMKNYSKALSNQRRIEFRKSNKAGKELMTGMHYLVLKNAERFNEKQTTKLLRLLAENANLNTLYIMK
jgi:transposase